MSVPLKVLIVYSIFHSMKTTEQIASTVWLAVLLLSPVNVLIYFFQSDQQVWVKCFYIDMGNFIFETFECQVKSMTSLNINCNNPGLKVSSMLYYVHEFFTLVTAYLVGLYNTYLQLQSIYIYINGFMFSEYKQHHFSGFTGSLRRALTLKEWSDRDLCEWNCIWGLFTWNVHRCLFT